MLTLSFKISEAIRNSLGNTRLSRPTITRRIGDLSQGIENALEMKINQICELQNKKICEFYSIALDESTDISDTAQL